MPNQDDLIGDQTFVNRSSHGQAADAVIPCRCSHDLARAGRIHFPTVRPFARPCHSTFCRLFPVYRVPQRHFIQGMPKNLEKNTPQKMSDRSEGKSSSKPKSLQARRSLNTTRNNTSSRFSGLFFSLFVFVFALCSFMHRYRLAKMRSHNDDSSKSWKEGVNKFTSSPTSSKRSLPSSAAATGTSLPSRVQGQQQL